MKKTAVFIFLLAIGAFAVNAQDDTRTSPSTNPSETVSPSSPTSPANDAANPGSLSIPEGTGTNSMHGGTKLQLSDLPKAISDNISSQHKGWTTKEVYKVDLQGATAYEVIVKKDDQKMNLVYDSNGNLLKGASAKPGKTSDAGSSTETEMK